MGVDAAAVKFMAGAKSFGVDFSDTLTVGRQGFFVEPDALKRVFSALGLDEDVKQFCSENEFSESFFRLLGAEQVSSVDYSSYEGATYICDMNKPVADELRSKFSMVFDGGTLEHVFNVPQGLKNCMEMVRVGGHFIQINIANNFMGHGFWQFSPELLFRVFSKQNGFEIKTVMLHEVVPEGAWYAVADPNSIRQRVELCNAKPTYVLTIAKRISDVEIFAEPPLQSDYVDAWDQSVGSGDSGGNDVSGKPENKLKKFIRRAVRRIPGRSNSGQRSSETADIDYSKLGFEQACYTQISEKELLNGQLK